MPSAPVANFARADIDAATAKTDNRIKNPIIVKRFLCPPFLIRIFLITDPASSSLQPSQLFANYRLKAEVAAAGGPV